MRISDWSSDVCSSDLHVHRRPQSELDRDAEVRVVRRLSRKFLAAACARFKDDVAAMEAEAAQFEEHIELTSNCSDDRCYGQALRDWQFHACGNSLQSHSAILDLPYKDIPALTRPHPPPPSPTPPHTPRVQLRPTLRLAH